MTIQVKVINKGGQPLPTYETRTAPASTCAPRCQKKWS